MQEINTENIEEKQFNFLSALTFIVVLIYCLTLSWALITKLIAFELWIAAMATPTGSLLGYWAKTNKTP